eukprot:CAMPEP_0113650090 /NCGR_PEP_ID=MMETSP0017_2-20120614/26642_1 /TAXON_ID=2856 /ORGANISM="Cylindrotheca closterium" /LENGTH=113 /DNA_ID=CAMNT_0000562557 /DNA_START=90 /DNA_END=431 /DNA_ORIENTATION=+ /assembly_acc=CAM_ASM_000147
MQRRDRPVSSVFDTPIIAELVSPTENDVLIIGGHKSTNMGNQRFRVIVSELSRAYETGNKATRKDLVNWAIHSVHDSGGRFLKQHAFDFWEELPKDQIRKTVTQAYRNSFRRR